ncbi:unnamed protein product, partial [Scytosiphon promiscuus]
MRKATKGENDVKEEAGGKYDGERKEVDAIAPRALTAPTAAAVVAAAEKAKGGEQKEETACATLFSRVSPSGQAALSAAMAPPSTEAVAPAATANIADGGRGPPTPLPSARAPSTFSPCHPAHAGCKSSPGEIS